MVRRSTLHDLDLQGGSPAAIEKRKARKRELDRKCQQRKRQNEREMMSKLREQVKALEQTADDNRVYNLLLRQEKDQERIKKHLDRMKRIEALIQEDFKALGEDYALISAGPKENDKSTLEAERSDENLNELPISSPIARPDKECVATQQVDKHSRSYLDAMTWDDPLDGVETYSDRDSSDQSPGNYVDPENMAALDASLANPASVNLSELPSMSLPLQENPDSNWALRGSSPLADTQAFLGQDCHKCDSMWSSAESAIVHSQEASSCFISNHEVDETDAHILVTGIVDGWTKAAKNQHWNKQWDSLRQIDVSCLSMCGPVERASNLYVVLRLFKCQRFLGDPLAMNLPPYLRARPSQLSVPHSRVVDHFIWPGFRENLVFDHGKYHFNTFSKDFGQSVRFLWPYEFRDTYLKNRQTGHYSFSSDFLHRVNDIRCFTMRSQFLNKYPEFQGGVPVFNTVSRMVSPADVSMATFCHFDMPKVALEEREMENLKDVEEIRMIMA